MNTILNVADREAILARIEKLSPGSRAQWGVMNVDLALCHCADVFREQIGKKQFVHLDHHLKQFGV